MPQSSSLSPPSPSTATLLQRRLRLGAFLDSMKVISQLQKMRHILIAVAFISAISLPFIANQSLRNFSAEGGKYGDESNLRSRVDMNSEDGAIYLGTYFEQREDGIELLIQRNLAGSFVEEEDFEGFVMPEDLENQPGILVDVNSHFENKDGKKSIQSKQTGLNKDSKEYAIRPYNLTDVLYAADIYDSTFVTLVWDPDEDVFISFYSERHYWASSCDKLLASITSVTFMLKHLFPWRFQKGKSAEFALAVSGGDYPGVKVTDCVLGRWSEPCARTAPILNFGSVFQRPIFPNMIAMPMPDVHHLRCFENWVRYKNVCNGLKDVEDGGDLVFGAKSFEDLIPQVVWRGSEFGYLGKFFTDLKHPIYEAHIEGNINPNAMKLKGAARVLRAMYDDLVPRWQGVVHTAEAEIEARRTQSLPWANIKFSHYMENGHKTEAVGSKGFEKWEEINFPAAGESMSLKELAQYKYHIDLGGGGGTTWSGTIIKLAMPGLLFHHVTPTKDYIHDRMKPWFHYIPVRADLSDLKSKFDWAESHPDVAARIARQATELARKLGTPEGFEEMFKEDFEEPLRQMIAAYQPSGQYHWSRVMNEVEGDLLKPIVACTVGGIHDRNHCQRLIGTEPFIGRARRAPPRSS